MELEFEKEKEAPKEKLPDSNPLTNLLTLNNFIDFSDRISKLEHEKVQSEQLIERFERENDDLKNQLIISQNQQTCLQDSLDISQDRNKGILLRGILVSTTKPLVYREFQFISICFLLNNIQFIRKQNCKFWAE